MSCGADISEDVPDDEPELFYVLYNIYAVHNFFNQWGQASKDALNRVALDVENIVTTISPVQKEETNVDTNVFLTILAGIFSIIPGVGGILVGAMQGVSKAMTAAAQAGFGAISATPWLFKAAFPMGTIEHQSITIASVKDSVGRIIDSFESKLRFYLKEVQTEMDSFIAFSKSGAFCDNVTDLNLLKDHMQKALFAYILSLVYEANDIHIVKAPNTNPQELATQQGLAWDIDCPGYDEFGMCNAWYYHKESNTAYTLNDWSSLKGDSIRKNDALANQMRAILKGYTTGALLFEDAGICAAQGQQSNGVKATVEPKIGLTLSCVSQLKVYSWKMDSTDVAMPNVNNEFADSPAQPGWEARRVRSIGGDAKSCQNGCYQLRVPYGYLGYFLHSPKGLPGAKWEYTNRMI
ncbi:MAG: hypothetical protein M1837_007287 [Sclerophora amabilis]|nr:MAG: hypothetical protein M1837_007287 [Sclerophora amabilis]